MSIIADHILNNVLVQFVYASSLAASFDSPGHQFSSRQSHPLNEWHIRGLHVQVGENHQLAGCCSKEMAKQQERMDSPWEHKPAKGMSAPMCLWPEKAIRLRCRRTHLHTTMPCSLRQEASQLAQWL